MPGSLFNLGRYFSKNTDGSTSGEVVGDGSESTVTEEQSSMSTTEHKERLATPVGDQHAQAETKKMTQSQSATSTSSSTTDMSGDTFQKRAGMDVLSRLTQRSNKALIAGVNKAKEFQNQFVDTEYVLWGLLQDSGIYQLISESKITPTEILKSVEQTFKKDTYQEAPKFSPRVKKVLELSFPLARRLGYEFISPEHILIALVQEGEGLAAQILTKFGLTAEKLQQKITGKKEKEQQQQEKSASLEFATDLTQLAREGKLDPVIARSQEIERIMHILSRRTKNNPILIGDAGVGKTAIVEGLAERIVAGNVPETLLNKRILSLDLTALLAGASHRGEFEKRFKKLIEEIKASQGEILLFIDEIHNMVGAGGTEGTMDASNILKPSLARGEVQTIGTTTITEYRKYIEKDRALERRFQPVMVPEPTQDQAIEMLRALKDKYEAFHKVSISDKAIDSAVRLSARYIGDRFLPDKAVDLIDEAASAVRLPAISLPEEIRTIEEKLKRQEAEKQEAVRQGNTVRVTTLDRDIAQLTNELNDKKQQHERKKGATTSAVTPDAIQEIVARWTGIPIARLTESESDKLVRLEDIIHRKIIDQEEAVAAVSEAVRRGRSGLTSQKRPIGSFIFMGPTGVGKTELAKVLAEELFGSEDMIVRLDMTEYMEKHEVAKLIGAPPGYVGYEEGGQLTEAVRRKPYSVVLLDEIEKAHPDVFNILLQILDDGRLTDNKGRTISFKNTILICTSNIGTGLIQQSLLEGMTVGPLKLPNKKETTINTYAISPTGREMVSRDGDYWQKEPVEGQQPVIASQWIKKPLAEYFAGQTVTGVDLLTPQEKFPMKGVSTHVVLPSGEEILTAGDRLWRRKSTIAKEWESMLLLDYIKDQTVTNAHPDKPEEQLPTAGWKTHAVSPQEKEIISSGTRVWIRETLRNNNWKTYKLSEYLRASGDTKTEQLVNGVQQSPASGPVETSPAVSQTDLPDEITAHLFTPSGKELIIADSTCWMRESGQQSWQKSPLTEILSGQGAPVISPSVADTSHNEAYEKKFMQLTEQLLEELRKFFKPELLNRFDEVIVFRPLAAEHMLAIVNLQLVGLTKNLEEQNFGLEISDGAKEELTIVGFDPIYGARPLRRTVQRLVENPISTMLIQGKVQEGDTIIIDFDTQSNDFVFSTRHVNPTPPPTKPEEQKEPMTDQEQVPPANKEMPEQIEVKPATVSETPKPEGILAKEPTPAKSPNEEHTGEDTQALSAAMNTNGARPVSPSAETATSVTPEAQQQVAGTASPIIMPFSEFSTKQNPVPPQEPSVSGSTQMQPA